MLMFLFISRNKGHQHSEEISDVLN